MSFIDDMPPGCLDNYRKMATFNWKSMKEHLFSKERIELMNEAYDFLEREPIFDFPEEDPCLEEERRLTFMRMKKIYTSEVFNPDDIFTTPWKRSCLSCVLGTYDWSLLARHSLLRDFNVAAIMGLGTDQHSDIIQALINLEVGFTFCLTEISHGTNTKGLRTEARYNPETQSFILHTPDFEAAKCWAGCLSKTATHALVFAQLYTPDGNCHGLHGFIVPVRDPRSMKSYAGATIIDMGPKIGLNGVDNGILMLDHYSIPRKYLLNRNGDVSPSGQYTSPISDPSKRFGASLGNLSFGRIGIVDFGVTNLRKSVTIAIRYSHVRKQFGPGKNELPVIEYPLQQWRLFPFLASAYALHIFSLRLQRHTTEFVGLRMSGSDPKKLDLFGQEIHGLSCAGKPISGWLARDCIQECREACGGHGYLKVSGLGYLRNDNDANCTYEGDNNVILQQTSNWLLALWKNRYEMPCHHPMRTTNFINTAHLVFHKEWNADTYNHQWNDTQIINASLEGFEWLMCWLCVATSNELDKLNKEMDSFTSRNHSQVFRAHSLSLAYIEHVMLSWFKENIDEAPQSLRPPLKKLCALFALNRLMKHVHLLVEGGILNRSANTISNIQWHTKRLLEQLLPDSLALVDAIAPPDFVLRSALGSADGKVYERLQQAMLTGKDSLQRPTYWQDINYGKILSKI